MFASRPAIKMASCRLRLCAQAHRLLTSSSATPRSPPTTKAAIATKTTHRFLSSEPPTYQPGSISHWATGEEAEGGAGGGADSPSPASKGEVDWSKSFRGVSTRPVSEEQFQVLMKPVAESDIEVKPDGVIYLPEIKYRRRLNEAFGPMGWGLIPKGDPVVGQSIVTREYALIVNSRFVSQAQGENPFFGPDSLPSAVEGCKSNALMRCCKDLGIASELWDPQYVRWFKKNNMEEVWVEHTVTKKKRTFWYRKGMVDVAYPYRISPNSRN
ncbi:hypothetical protein L249_2598 [Ophiocordyceps polyrhachis-furcata BCC 54312]|uniref:Mitochondrial genome maintenance protein MGM101 n=1 Tax=Ophiocordyceps polyrhachis-furcata BCC 54312 TaxID=1330021 RepID=A0A367LRP5_9HYPO|nr:hypothetical protein L249_2598 [Ophiocordyceps polyrhachis-furcata BCC 54312]